LKSNETATAIPAKRIGHPAGESSRHFSLQAGYFICRADLMTTFSTGVCTNSSVSCTLQEPILSTTSMH